MTFDSWLIARLARELEALLRGARVQALQSSDTGFTLSCYRRGQTLALHVLLDQSAPLAAVAENAAAPKEKGAGGWAASVAALLRGCTVDAIQAVPNDRVILVDLSSRSAFGLPSTTRLVLELQPRKANILVLRAGNDATWVTVAAAKQFHAPALSLNARSRDGVETASARDVAVGAPYVLPPPRKPAIDRAQFLIQSDRLGEDRAALARLLGELDPACTPLVAREVVYRALAGANPSSSRTAALSRRLLDAWQTVRAELDAAEVNAAPLFLYRDADQVVACHLIELQWPALEPARPSSLNELCLGALEANHHAKPEPDLAATKKRLETMLSRSRKETAVLERAVAKASDADELRAAGETIYAHLSAIPAGAKEFSLAAVTVRLDPTLSAKANAAQYFRRYKKARSGLPQMRARLRTLAADREFWEQLLWELDRAASSPPPERAATVAEIKAAAGLKERKPSRPARALREERKVALSDGAIAYVGRSPKDNERLTFTVAGPNDYWFHARGIPGAHILVKTGGAHITSTQIEQAAALAAEHSRGQKSGAVDVDFTQRKHVRRQRAGRPGLVWYEKFQTVRVSPAAARDS